MELYSIKKQLEESESRIGSYVGEVNRQINNTWSPREILYMDAYYGWKRYKANLLIKPDRKSSLLSEERFLKEKLSGLPGMNCNQSVGEMMIASTPAVIAFWPFFSCVAESFAES